MLAALIITLRETLEAALVAGILLAYLDKTGNVRHSRYVWYGVAGGITVSLIVAFIFQNYFGGFTGRAEEVYEGITMLVAAGLITWMIFWMLGQRGQMRKNIENKAEYHLKNDHPLGLFLLTFVSVAREGVETVIFLQAAILQIQNNFSVFSGAIIGIFIAIILSYLFFRGMHRFPLRTFFTVTSVILILFAAGLLAHGIHEFQEAGVLPIYIEHLWNTNWLIDENGTFGSLLKGLFGYNGNPSLLEVIGYAGYLAVSVVVWKKMAKSR